MESKLKALMKRVDTKNKEIQKMWKAKSAKKVASYALKLKAMAEYARALEAKDLAGMKKTEGMCWDAKKLRMDAKKMHEKIMKEELEKKKMIDEYCQLMLDWEKQLMKKKYSFSKC